MTHMTNSQANTEGISTKINNIFLESISTLNGLEISGLSKSDP
jgi:hypothetical protein